MSWIIVVIGLFVGLGCQETERYLTAVVAVGDGSTIVRWTEPRSVHHAARLDANQQVLWDIELDQEQTDDAEYGTSIVGDVVVFRGVRVWPGGGASLVMLEGVALADGTPRWTTAIGATVDQESDRISIGRPLMLQSVPSTSTVNEVVEVDGYGALVSVDPRSGHVVRRTGLPRARLLFSPITSGSQIVLHEVHTAHVFDPQRDRWSQLAVSGMACAGDAGFRGVVRDEEKMQWVDLSGRATSRQVPLPPDVSVAGCAWYGDSLVLELVQPDQGLELRKFDPSGTQIARLVVSRWRRSFFPDAPAMSSRGGELTRFVPYLFADDLGDEIHILDIERMVDVATYPGGIGLEVFRRGRIWYVTDWGAPTTITAFDGDTGALTGAVAIDTPVSPPRAASADEHGFWVFGAYWRRSSEVPLVRLDPRTLRPTFVSGGVVVDERDLPPR